MARSEKSKQSIVLQYAFNNEGITKKKAVELIGDQYYNQSKYVGETLSRMVNNGSLIRVKRGLYKVGSGNGKPGQPIPNKDQTKLF